MPETPVQFGIRSFRSDDAAAVDALIDAQSDALWIAQGHRLHGEARDGEKWRRTLVAEIDGAVAGAVTVGRNPVHPWRYSLAVEVAAASRRRGVARALIDEVRSLLPRPMPLAAKVRPSDAAGVALLRALGGRVYQQCPGLCPDPTSPAVRAWAARAAAEPRAIVVALAELPRYEWTELWVAQYLWVHRNWSPANEDALREVTPDLLAEVDPELSSVTFRGPPADAVTWVFSGPDGSAEIVAETTLLRTRHGVGAVAASLGRSLSELGRRGVRRAELDGHATDPHLGPALETFPPVPREPLDLVEIPPTAPSPDHARLSFIL